MTEEEWEELEAVEVPIDGTLDLHTFHPRDLKELLPDYLAACRRAGILQVRVIHGKGTGQLRRSVHAILGRLPQVEAFRLAGDGGGGWGRPWFGWCRSTIDYSFQPIAIPCSWSRGRHSVSLKPAWTISVSISGPVRWSPIVPYISPNH